MKSIHSNGKQRGFFDLGLGLGLLLLFGGTAVVATPDNGVQVANANLDNKPAVQETRIVEKNQD